MCYGIIYIIYESLGSNTAKFSGYLRFFSFENLQKHVLKISRQILSNSAFEKYITSSC